jgi:hypothetical protein
MTGGITMPDDPTPALLDAGWAPEEEIDPED